MENVKVSVIIPTFNRFKYLLNAIDSIKKQTYKNIEIIVVNDCSTQVEYYNHKFEDCIIIHLNKNSKKIFGHACSAHVRNMGIKIATGDYIAFLDDDDVWFPNKIELQLEKMREKNCHMSCTDALIGHGIYDPHKSYKIYNKEHYFECLCNIYGNKGRSDLLNKDINFPDIWNFEFINVHNCCITSSVMIKKELLEKVNCMPLVINGIEDYTCWLNILKYTNCAYVNQPCLYYDLGHGYGQNH